MTPVEQPVARRSLWTSCGAVAGALAVGLGAFGAHRLELMVEAGRFSATMLDTFEVAVRYQMYHALALVALGAWTRGVRGKAITLAGAAFLIGIVVFSGMLYAYVFTGVKAFAMVVPLGGVSFIVGWIALAVAALRQSPTE